MLSQFSGSSLEPKIVQGITLYMILLLHRAVDHRTFHVPCRAFDAMPDCIRSFMIQTVGERKLNPIASAVQLIETLKQPDQLVD